MQLYVESMQGVSRAFAVLPLRGLLARALRMSLRELGCTRHRFPGCSRLSFAIGVLERDGYRRFRVSEELRAVLGAPSSIARIRQALNRLSPGRRTRWATQPSSPCVRASMRSECTEKSASIRCRLCRSTSAVAGRSVLARAAPRFSPGYRMRSLSRPLPPKREGSEVIRHCRATESGRFATRLASVGSPLFLMSSSPG